MKLPDFVKVYGDGESRVNATVIVGKRGAVVVDTRVTIFVPEHGVLLTGDNVFSGRTPYVGDADVPRWLEVLTKLHALGPDVVIPGHGPVGGKEILVRQRDWLEAFLGLAQDCFRKGVEVEEAADKVIAELKADPARRQVLAEGIRNIYRSVSARAPGAV